MDKLINILNEIRPDIDFAAEDKLIDNNVLDSYDIISIVGELNDTFDVSINGGDFKPENFNSAKAMWALVESYKSRI